MSKKIICDADGCGKELGINTRSWYHLRLIYKERDYGMEQDIGTLDLCSKECIEKELLRLEKSRIQLQEKGYMD